MSHLNTWRNRSVPELFQQWPTTTYNPLPTESVQLSNRKTEETQVDRVNLDDFSFGIHKLRVNIITDALGEWVTVPTVIIRGSKVVGIVIFYNFQIFLLILKIAWSSDRNNIGGTWQ